MPDPEVLEAYQHARAHSHALGLCLNPMFDTIKQVAGKGANVAAVTRRLEEAGQRARDWPYVHELVEETYRPHRDDLTEWGREQLCNEATAEAFAPIDEVLRVTDTRGWDLPAVKDACPMASWEVVARRVLMAAWQRDVSLFVTIIDDARVYLRASSENPERWCHGMLPEETGVWRACLTGRERSFVQRSCAVEHAPVTVRRGGPLPTPAEARKLSDDAGWALPTLDVRCWPVPRGREGTGVRREVMLSILETS